MAGKASVSNPKKFIANLRKLTHICEFLQKKKRNVISKNREGGGQRLFGIFPKKNPLWRIRTSLNCMQLFGLNLKD